MVTAGFDAVSVDWSGATTVIVVVAACCDLAPRAVTVRVPSLAVAGTVTVTVSGATPSAPLGLANTFAGVTVYPSALPNDRVIDSDGVNRTPEIVKVFPWATVSADAVMVGSADSRTSTVASLCRLHWFA